MSRRISSRAIEQAMSEPDVGVFDSLKKKATKGTVAERVLFAITVVETIGRVITKVRDLWRRHLSYSVVVSEKDALYGEVHAWLLDTLPDEKHRAVAVGSSARSHDDDWETVAEADDGSGPVAKAKPLIVRYNESTTRKVVLDGHQIMVSLVVPDTDRMSLSREPDYAKIHFTARSHAGQKAVLDHLTMLNNKRATARRAVLKMVGQWGSWTTRSDLPPRTMASVILPREQKERVVNDLRKFLESEDKYNRLALPWHRGYMFHGPPGTGKTSLVKALANEFNLDLWYVSLSDLKQESSLLSLLSNVTPRSLLLLEDIDTMRITHDREGSEQGAISMSSLLNTLDGVATPHGLITIMTTNRFEVLDPALTRAGRMDMVELLDYPSVSTVAEMYTHFFGKSPNWPLEQSTAPLEGLSTSQVAEVMKRHMDDPAAARDAVLDILNQKR